MSASTKRALSLLLSGAFIIASLAVFVTLVAPEFRIARELSGELRSARTLLERAQRDKTQVDRLIAEYRTKETALQALLVSFPEGALIPDVIGQVNAIAQSSGMLLRSVSISYLPVRPSLVRLTSATNIGTVRLRIEMSGSYASLKRFLQLVETNIRIMDTQNFSISPAGRPDQDVYNYTISIDTYYQAR